MYKQTGFYILVLCLNTLLKSLTALHGFSVHWCRLSTYINNNRNNNNIMSSHSAFIVSHSSSNLTVLANTSRKMLNNSDDIGHACIVPGFDVNTARVSPLNTRMAWQFPCWERIHLFLFNVEFLSKWMLDVAKCLPRFPLRPRLQVHQLAQTYPSLAPWGPLQQWRASWRQS